MKGTIASEKSKVTLAQVMVLGSGESTFTDDAGQYLLAGIEPGERIIQASAQGYRSLAKTIVIAQPGEIAKQDFTLIQDAHR